MSLFLLPHHDHSFEDERIRLAAEQGDPGSQCTLGVMLQYGDDTDKDEQQAVVWYKKAAARGLARAQHNLAVCLSNGLGVVKDEKQAVEWYRRAAETGFEKSQVNLGYCLEHGFGTAVDKVTAAVWYGKAAERGSLVAMHNLAVCFAAGRGVDNDFDRAMSLHARAATDGFAESTRKLLMLKSQVKPEADNPVVRWRIGSRRSVETLFPESFAFEKLLPTSTFCQAVLCRDKEQAAVVVKVPLDPNFNKVEWLNEVLALSRLPEHPNVLKLLGICHNFECSDAKGKRLNPKLSYVTQYIAQGSIVEYFSWKGNKGNSIRFLLPWALDIARGLAHLHANRCVHRDLAARNVFIDKDNRAIIGDFGLARPLDKTGVFKSEEKSAAYPMEAAPQVIRQQEYSPASDVFDFGLTLFDIATSCEHNTILGFSESNASARVAKIRHLDAHDYQELLKKLPANVPTSMAKLIRRCLEFKPEERPSAAELVLALEALSTSSGV